MQERDLEEDGSTTAAREGVKRKKLVKQEEPSGDGMPIWGGKVDRVKDSHRQATGKARVMPKHT